MPPRRRRRPEEERTQRQRARDFSTQNARGRAAGERIQRSFRNSVRGVQQSRATQATNLITGQAPRRTPVNRTTGQAQTAAQQARIRGRISRATPGEYNAGRANRRARAVLNNPNASRDEKRRARTVIKNTTDTR